MNAFFGARTEQLREVGGTIEKGSADLDRIIERLRTSIDGVTWAGEARWAYRGGVRRPIDDPEPRW